MKTTPRSEFASLMATAPTRRQFLKGAAGGAFAALAGGLGSAAAHHDPNPAAGGIRILATGVSPIPTNPFAWRLVSDLAARPGDGEALERALGFVYATGGDIDVIDGQNGPSRRLAQGEATFVPEGVVERRESAENRLTPYLRIALVPPEDADFTAGGDLLYGSESFDAPSGPRRIVLLAATLGVADSAPIPDSDAPTLFFVTRGALIVGNMGHPVTLGSGMATAIGGPLTVYGHEQHGAEFIAAQISNFFNEA